jgi:hypothetical protein
MVLLEIPTEHLIDPAGSRVTSLNNAMVRLDPEDFINIRKIEILASQRHTRRGSATAVQQIRITITSPSSGSGRYSYDGPAS